MGAGAVHSRLWLAGLLASCCESMLSISAGDGTDGSTEAAASVVNDDLLESDPSARRLLSLVTDPTDSAVAREQLAALWLTLFGQRVTADDASLDPAIDLFEDTLDRTGHAQSA